MRAKLAVVVAVAVVFAPGWGASASVARSQAPSDLTGRILAPTFEEGSLERLGKVGLAKGSYRGKPRPFVTKLVLAVASPAALHPPTPFLLAALVVLAFRASRRIPTVGAQRAPPPLTV